MKKNTIIIGAVMLLSGCSTQQLPTIINMPYCDANMTRPLAELTQIERTDSTTELTFMAMYNDYDTNFNLGDEINLIGKNVVAPLKEVKPIGNTVIMNNNVIMHQGVPSQFKLIFPALPENITSIDLIQKKNGKVMTMFGETINQIWGIDLTGKRSPDEFPSDIPSNLIKPDLATGNLPQIVRKDGVAKITAHAVAWRDWMDPQVRFIVNTIDDTQEIIKSKFNKDGIVTIEIPLKGTASISAGTPYNVYSDFYIDPGEDINLYIMPTNSSATQRFIRPNSFTDGKYRNIMAMRNKLLWANLNEYADTLLLDKTNTDEYFEAMMKIHSAYLDTIKVRNFEPDMEKYARGAIDRTLMYQTLSPDAYTPRDWDKRDSAKPDSVLRFSPEQVEKIRSSIDFNNPMLELRSIGNPGNRSRFLQAKELLLSK